MNSSNATDVFYDLTKQVLFTRPWARILILALSLLSAIAGLTGPYLQKEFIDHLTASSHLITPSLGNVHPLIIITGAFFSLLLAMIFSQLANYLAFTESVILQKNLGEFMFNKTLQLRTDTLASRQMGEVVSLYATDITGATFIIESSLPTGAAILFPLVLAPLAISWLFAIPLFSTVAVMLFIVFLNVVMAYRQSRFFFAFKQLAAERTGLVNEWIQNIRALRILGWVESMEARIFKKRVEETRNRVLMVTNGQFMNAVASSITFFINILAIVTLVYTHTNNITPGQLLALLWIVGVFLVRPFRQLPWFFTFVLDGTTSLKRLSKYFALENKSSNFQEFGLAADKPAKGPHIKVKGLNLAIKNQTLLKDLCFEAREGEFIAIVGPVGSGKSLLLLSLLGETGAQFSEYEINGISALKMSIHDLRKHFAFVPQEGFVMSASLRENIAFEYEFGSQGDKDIINSLKRAQFDLDRESLSRGLETEIGERGVNLSGGQKQRVSLARAHYFSSPILLLDDSLSAVDVDTEKILMQKLLKGDWSKCTRILVTHRLSTLKTVDRIIFIEDGRIVDVGTFNELNSRSEDFQKFTASINKSSGPQPEALLPEFDTDDKLE